MALDDAGVQLIAAGVAAYVSDLNKADNATTGFYKTLGSSDKSANAFQQVITGALRHVGAALVDFAVQGAKAIGGFVKDSVDVAGDFEAGMHKFQAVAGDAVDTKGLEKFKDLFISLGKELPVSTSEVEQAAIEMVSGGIDPAIVAGGALRQTIQFAAAAGLSLADAAGTSAKFLAGWTSASATTAEKVDFLTQSTDALTKAAAASSTTAAELRLGIFNVQGAAQALHAPFNDVVATLAKLAPAFESSAQAGTALNVFMTRLVPQTNVASDKMKELGLITRNGQNIFFDAQGNFLGMAHAAEALSDMLGGLTDQQKIESLHTLFGNDAMKVANLLMVEGANGINDMKSKMDAANGVASTAALVQSGYNTALENAKGSVEALQIRIGTGLLPVLTDLLNNYIAPGVNTITSFAEAFIKMVPAIEASDDPIQTFLNAMKIAAPGLMDMIVAVEDFKDAITPAVNEIMRLADAFDQGGLSGLIDTVVADLTAAAPDIEAALLSWGQAFLDWIIPMIPPLIKQLGGLESAAWDWVKQQAPGWGKQLMVWGEEFVTWIAPMIPPAIAELGKLGQSFVAWIGDQAAPLLRKFNDWATSFVAWIVPATVDFLARWPKMFDQFLEWIGNEAGPLLKKLGDWALSFIEWIAPMIPPFLVALAGVALAIITWIGETALVLAGKIKDKFLPAIIGWIVTDAVPGLYKALESIWKVFQSWILDIEKELAQRMRDVGKAIIDGIISGVEYASGKLFSSLKNMAGDALQAAKDALGISSPSTEFAKVGQWVIQGFVQGMQDELPVLTTFVDSFGADLVGKMGDIADQIQGVIADAFGATASIDRQAASNLDKLKDVLPEYLDYTKGALAQAQSEAQRFEDPAQGAKYYAMKSKQILEYAKLQKDLADAETAEDRARIQQQMLLINAAQSAEIAQFNANQQSAQGPLAGIAGQINDIMKALSGQNLTDDQIHMVDMLAGLFQQLSAPQSNPYANPTTTMPNVTNSQTINMPVYTNQSPAVVRDSMAVMGASLL